MAFLNCLCKGVALLFVSLLLGLTSCQKQDAAVPCSGNLDYGQLRLQPESLSKIPYIGNEKIVFVNPSSGERMVFFPRQDSLQVALDFSFNKRTFFCGEDPRTLKFRGESGRLSYRSQEGYLLNLELSLMDVQLDSGAAPVLFDLLSIALHKPIYGPGGSVQQLNSCSLELIASMRGQPQLENSVLLNYKNFEFRQNLGSYDSGGRAYQDVWMTECSGIDRILYAEETGLVEFVGDDGRLWVYEAVEFFDETKAANIALPDTSGTIISLEDIGKKVILLGFWASWSLPSRTENLETLKPLYERFGGSGLEIYSISLDTKRKDWVAAIQGDDLPWVQVSDLEGVGSPVFDEYRLTGLPTVWVLDRERRVLARGLSGRVLSDFVVNLFN